MIRYASACFKIRAALPVYTVLTLSATGSEMNKNAVLSDMTRNVKASMSSDLLKPRMSICDPTYTYSVPKSQTAAGTADMISHAFENYFSPVRDAFMGYRLGEAVLRTCFRYGPVAMEEPDNYEARESICAAHERRCAGDLQGLPGVMKWLRGSFDLWGHLTSEVV